MVVPSRRRSIHVHCKTNAHLDSYTLPCLAMSVVFLESRDTEIIFVFGTRYHRHVGFGTPTHVHCVDTLCLQCLCDGPCSEPNAKSFAEQCRAIA